MPDPTPTPAKPPAPAPLPSPTAKIDELAADVAGLRRALNETFQGLDEALNNVGVRVGDLEALARRPVPTAKTVYSTGVTPEARRQSPGVRPLNWFMYGMIYNLAPGNPPHPQDPGDIHPECIERLADICLFGGRPGYGGAVTIGGAPFAFDFEGTGHGWDVIPAYCRYVTDLRRQAPGVPIGFLSIDWFEAIPGGLGAFVAAMETPEGRALMAQLADAYRPLVDVCDFITFNAYITKPEDADGCLAANDAMMAWLRRTFPRAPLWPVLSSRYSMGPVVDGALLPLSREHAWRSWTLAERWAVDVIVIHPTAGKDSLPDWPTAAGVFGGWVPRP